ncbi:MAG: hypothetical protein Q7J78_02855 [Clostridiales bacterium]|nr:hypothetical protein [Clostridiales bacterium]
MAPDRGSKLLPGIFELTQKNNIPLCSYFCIGADLLMSNLRDTWVVTGSRETQSTSVGLAKPIQQ